MKTLIITETEFHHGSKVSEAQSKINAILTNKRYYVIHLGIKDEDIDNAFKRFYWDSIFPIGTLRGNPKTPVTEKQISDVIDYCLRKDMDLVIVSNNENPIMAQNVMEEVIATAEEYALS